MRITANQVTSLRLILMPALAAFLYLGTTARWWALFLGTLVGLTDFVDGWLARRQGPTVLGGLMDPIADKVFLAMCCVPYAHLGWAPEWAVLALLLREFVITALRSSLELRGRTLASTYLAKIKTWVQMTVMAVILWLSLEPSAAWVSGFLFAGAALTALGVVAIGVARRRFWRGGVIFAGCFAAGGAGYLALGARNFAVAIMAGAVLITWVSGIDYLVAGARALRFGRALTRFDAVRLAGAVLIPVLSVTLLIDLPASWGIAAITGLVSLELANGGLDNLLAHHGAADSAWSWGTRVLGASLFLGAALLFPLGNLWLHAAFAVCLAGTIVAFWRNRRFYLEEKLREKKARVQPAPASTI